MLTGRLKLLHTSDFHLGANFNWADGHSDLDVVAQTAQFLNVDALLIAGDLFDSSQITIGLRQARGKRSHCRCLAR